MKADLSRLNWVKYFNVLRQISQRRLVWMLKLPFMKLLWRFLNKSFGHTLNLKRREWNEEWMQVIKLNFRFANISNHNISFALKIIFMYSSGPACWSSMIIILFQKKLLINIAIPRGNYWSSNSVLEVLAAISKLSKSM